MSRRSVYSQGAVLLAAAVAAFACAAAAAADGGPVPLSPEAASALIAAPGSGAVRAGTVVTSAAVLAAASLPGADTSVESDLTPNQAVGLAAAKLAGTIDCWADKGWWGWGTWPYDQKITDTTYWCAVYGSKVTFRTTTVTADGTLCGVSWRASQVIAGGVGFPYFTTRSSAGFSCPTVIPWITLHPTHYIDIRRDDRGGASFVGHG